MTRPACLPLAVFGLTLCQAVLARPAVLATVNAAPNPSFESEARRLGGWMPVGVEPTNVPSRVFITNSVHRGGVRALCVLPGPPGAVAGRRFVASYNGGEDEIMTIATNGIVGARTIALRLDEDIGRVTGSIWIRGEANAGFRLSLVWTGREGRRPAVVLHEDGSDQAAREEGGWRLYRLAGTRPIRTHQVQLWVEGDSTAPFYLDDAEVILERVAGQQVLVDQLGYETASATKVAMLQSSVPLNSLPVARLIELETFREVLRSDWHPCDPVPDWDRFHWTFDFSKVTAAGRYAVAAGEGKAALCSPPFEIADGLLRRGAAEAGYRFFYYQRCGAAVPGFHAACHLDDARMPDGGHRDLSGGWHDAGDYNKYCGFTPESVYALAVAYHRQPQLFDQWDRNHDGRADLLEELTWGADFLVRMLDRDSLELVGTISTGYRFWGAPEEETNGRSGDSDDRPVKQLGGDRTWCAAGLALAGLAWTRAGDAPRGEAFIQTAIRLYEKAGGNVETLAALHAATRDARYLQSARAQAESLLGQAKPEDGFRALGEFAVAFPTDPLVAHIKAVAERRVTQLEAACAAPFRVAGFATGGQVPSYFQPYADVNDWYVGGTMRHLDVAIEGALAARIGVGRGRSLAENQVHWILGRNPFGVSLMEGVGSRFVPNYHHRYNAIPGNPRGAVPGALLNGIVRAWPHQDRPWLDMSAEPNADYHCNEPWLPYNNRWMILMSLW